MRRFFSLSVLALLAACQDSTLAPRMPGAVQLDVSPATSVGQVYTMTNQATGNDVLRFDRGADGVLTPAGSYSTDGIGTGGGLGNQGALTLASGDRFLLVVNAGSNDVSAFRVSGDGSLELTSRVASGGVRPVSVTERSGLVYVLNTGGTGNITGFTLSPSGQLDMITGSSRPVSSSAASAAQVQFSGNGKVLVVTERTTNRLSTYVVGPDGLATGPTVIASSGTTPFGFGISGSLLVVSEAFAGAANGSAVSSYTIGDDGALQLVSGSVPTTETAACWLVVTGNGRFAYAANAGSASISGYAVAPQGQLTLLDADGVTATTGAGPNELAVSRNSQFLYALNNGAHTITGYAVNANGSLTSVGAATPGLPAGSNGLAVR